MHQVISIELSIIVPVYNEGTSLNKLHTGLTGVLKSLSDSYEIIFCDDGSSDTSYEILRDICRRDTSSVLIKLSRNFGKEAALMAGLSYAQGKAVLMIDADGQHPVGSIPEFVKKWKAGAKVVVGKSNAYKRAGFIKKTGSAVFYRLFNSLSSQKLIEGTSDFRLIDREVCDEFLKLGEANRITRGLIDWLGYNREYVHYETKPRLQGKAHYSTRKLINLAANSFVSLSTKPLYFFGYVGVAISLSSLVLGIAIIIEQLILDDPMSWKFTGTAMLGVLIIFLVGIVLLSQGMLALYISHIHEQSKHRPLYVVDKSSSIGL